MERLIRLLLPVIVLLFWRTTVFATAVIAVVEEEAITIATDSLIRGVSAQMGQPVSQLCKIRCVGRLCFAAAGRYAAEKIGYNVFDFANAQLRRTQFPIDAAEGFRKSIMPIMPKLVAVSKTEATADFLEWQRGRPLLSYLFAGLDRGRASVITGEIYVSSTDNALSIQEKIRRGEFRRVRLVVMGSSAHIDKFLKETPEWANTALKDSIDFAEKMIAIEILANEKDGRHDIGGPISVVKLASVGVVLQKNGFCFAN